MHGVPREGAANTRERARHTAHRSTQYLAPISFLNYIVIQRRKVCAMAANEVVQARIDGAIKKEAAAVLATIGLTVSDAVRLMLTRVAREHALPFDPLIPNETTIAAMREARAGKLETVTLDQLQAVLDAND